MKKRTVFLMYLIFFIVMLPVFWFMGEDDVRHEKLDIEEKLAEELTSYDNYKRAVYYMDKCVNDSAFKYYNLACKDSNKFAFYNLGMMYYHGKVVKKDLVKSFQYVKRGAELNDSVSQYWLGMCYLHGIGTDTNLIESDYWLNLSKKNGYIYKE